MKILRALQHFELYNAGEVAGFDDAKAAELIALGVAVAVESGTPSAPLAASSAADTEVRPADFAAAEGEDAALEIERNGFYAKLDACKTKAELVEFGKANFDLDLSENSTRQKLIDQLVEAQAEIEQEQGA